MRVVGGTLRGRRLAAPPGATTRPTSDRVREAVFSVLDARFGGVVDAVVLDLFAGSGALGIEALSRGARWSTFVENDASALRTIRENLRVLRLEDRAAVVRGDATRIPGSRIPGGPFSLLVADPPYRIEPHQVFRIFEGLGASGLLLDGAVVVYECSASQPLEWPDTFADATEKRYGSTRVAFARWKRSCGS
ncbi:MAG: 16S rRNA (guanine(966)-N(2))-methyltransferase RsmD [Coriobacteriia bacterium]|nr:16S rRNA (guanine(966)-N(2))-methyltransferase RsmD [Coriobacteriia bacterium]